MTTANGARSVLPGCLPVGRGCSPRRLRGSPWGSRLPAGRSQKRAPSAQSWRGSASIRKCSPVPRLLVLRHAQSLWNAGGLFQGWSDAPLSELGEAQAARAGRALATVGVRPGLVACSDLARARRTAEVLAAETGYDKPLVVDVGLREQDLGDWNGLTRREVEERWPAELAERRRGRLVDAPGGESAAQFVARWSAALGRVGAAVCETGEEVAVTVTHGGVMLALEQALGAPGRECAIPTCRVGGWRSGARGAWRTWWPPSTSNWPLLTWKTPPAPCNFSLHGSGGHPQPSPA